jgi:hypothetical protein
MGIFLALLPALLCLALVAFIYGGDAVRALLRNAVLLDLLGDVFIQLMLGGPLIAFLLSKLGMSGGLDAHPGMAIVWMFGAIAVAYGLKSAARKVEALRAAPDSAIN